MPRQHPAVVTLPPHARSARDARRFVRRAVAAWSCAVPAETLELLVSELVANAVRHAGTAVRVALTPTGDRIAVEVRDGSPHRPRPRLPDDTSEAGRGLFLVDQLAREWGVREHPGGKTVWFVLEPLSQAVPAR